MAAAAEDAVQAIRVFYVGLGFVGLYCLWASLVNVNVLLVIKKSNPLSDPTKKYRKKKRKRKSN